MGAAAGAHVCHKGTNQGTEKERERAGRGKGGDVCAEFELICGSVNHFTESKVRVHRRQLSTHYCRRLVAENGTDNR